MTVVVQKDSRSSESAMNLGHFLPEYLSQAGNLFQLAYRPGVPHQEMNPSHQDNQEISQMGQGSGLGDTFLLAGPIESEPDSDTWFMPIGKMNLGHFLPEYLSQAGNLFQLAYRPGVPHQEMNPSHQDNQEISQMGQGSGLGGTSFLAGPIESEPDSDTWFMSVGNWIWEPQISSHVRQIGGLDMSGTFNRLQETSSVESVQMSIRASICHSFTKVAESEEEIVAAMRWYGLVAIADRLNRLKALIAEDPDEPDLVPESLRSFADFFMHEDRLPVPEVGVGPEGFLEAEWRIPAKREAPVIAPFVRWVRPDERYWGQGDGILAMKFLPSGSIQYAAVSGPVGRGKERLRSSGVYSKNSIMPAIQAFTSRLGLP